MDHKNRAPTPIEPVESVNETCPIKCARCSKRNEEENAYQDCATCYASPWFVLVINDRGGTGRMHYLVYDYPFIWQPRSIHHFHLFPFVESWTKSYDASKRRRKWRKGGWRRRFKFIIWSLDFCKWIEQRYLDILCFQRITRRRSRSSLNHHTLPSSLNYPIMDRWFLRDIEPRPILLVLKPAITPHNTPIRWHNRKWIYDRERDEAG